MTAETSPNSETQERWAVIIGISEYADDSLDLDFADRDAEALFETIQKPYAGGFKKENIRKLVNGEATATGIRTALNSFLKNPGKEDLVLIYFAGHGDYDRDRPDTVYFLPYETDRKNLGGTAVKMSEIQDIITDRILVAKRVIIFVDACHSAKVAPGLVTTRSGGDSSGTLNSYMKKLKGNNEGIAILTSAGSNETAQEDANLDGGHGVFTYYLLKGMNGAADKQPKDGTVTVDELFEYVTEQVKKKTGSQHPFPVIGQNAGMLPMSLPGTLSAEEYCELGKNLYLSGLLLDDDARFEAAIKQSHKARELKWRIGEDFPEAYLTYGLAEMALKNFSTAKLVFEEIQRMNASDDTKALANYYLSTVSAKQGEIDEAVRTCEDFLEKYPEHNKAPLVSEFKKLVSPKTTRKKYALLIGIGKNAQERIFGLPNIDNDILLMTKLLSEDFGFPSNHIEILRDEKATYENILEAIGKLKQTTTDRDIALVYFTGRALKGNMEPYILAYDVNYPQSTQSMIGSEQFHNLISEIPAHTTLILDTFSTNKFINLAKKDEKYTLFLGASPESDAFLGEIDGEVHGYFTYHLVESLKGLSSLATKKEIFKKTMSLVEGEGMGQVPLLISPNGDAPFIDGDTPARAIELVDFSRRRNYQFITLRRIERLYESIPDGFQRVFPELFYSFGQAFLEKHEYDKATLAFRNAIETSKLICPETILALGYSQLLKTDYGKALVTFELLEKVPPYADYTKKQIELIKQLKSGTRRALLIGIDDYMRGRFPVPSLRGAVNDVQAMKSVLVEKLGFKEENIKTLVNEEAKREAIIDAFNKLAKNAQEEPAVFYYAGYGGISRGELELEEPEPTILSHDFLTADGRGIPFSDLRDIVGESPSNLLSIIDASWKSGFRTPWGYIGSRCYGEVADTSSGYIYPMRSPKDTKKISDTENIQERAREYIETRFRIGRFSIYPISITHIVSSVQADFHADFVDEAEFPSLGKEGGKKVYGAMTYHLVKNLQKLRDPTYGRIEKYLGIELAWLNPYCCGFDKVREKLLFSNIVKAEEATANVGHLITRNLNEPLRKIVQIANNLTDKYGESSPELYLERGVALLAMKEDLAASISQFEEAISRSKCGSCVHSEAQYHLGCAYFLTGDLDQAITHLRDSMVGGRLSEYLAIRASYYLGKALQTRIEEQRSKALEEAQEAFRRYLGAGAPVGHVEEIEDFLKRTVVVRSAS